MENETKAASTRIIRYWLSGSQPIRPLVATHIRDLAVGAGREP